jgi:hypothetical protein
LIRRVNILARHGASMYWPRCDKYIDSTHKLCMLWKLVQTIQWQSINLIVKNVLGPHRSCHMECGWPMLFHATWNAGGTAETNNKGLIDKAAWVA